MSVAIACFFYTHWGSKTNYIRSKFTLGQYIIECLASDACQMVRSSQSP